MKCVEQYKKLGIKIMIIRNFGPIWKETGANQPETPQTF